MFLITVVVLGIYVAGFLLTLRMVRNNPPQNGSWFILPFLLWAVLGGFFWYWFSSLYIAFPLSFLLGLLFVGLPMLLGVGFFLLWAPALLPLAPDQEGAYRKVLNYFYGYLSPLPRPSWVVVDGVAEKRIDGNVFDGYGLGLVLTEPHTIVAFSDGSKIRGVEGPGTVFTGPGQDVLSVMDLREQIRPNKVECLTRDGIKVTVPFSPIFRIDPGSEPVTLRRPWPYRRAAAFEVLFSQEVDPTNKTPLDASHSNPWDDLPGRTAPRLVQQVIGAYRLDELYATKDPDKFPRSSLGKAIRERLVQEMQPKGIKVTAGGVGNSIMPVDSAVIRQRVETWKASWMQRIMQNSAKMHGEELEKWERVRSTARTEFLLKMTKQVKEFQGRDENFSAKLMAIRLLETLDDMARGPQMGAMSGSALTLIETLRRRLGE